MDVFSMFLFGVALGLLVGWNFLPQPEVVREKVAKVVAWFSEKF